MISASKPIEGSSEPRVPLEQAAILITGAAGGIGRACVIACVKQGWHVFAAMRNKQEGQERLREALQSSGLNNVAQSADLLTLLEYDVSDSKQVKAAFAQIKKSPYELVGLVNNAGLMKDSLLGMTSLDDFDMQMLVNVRASFLHLQLASRLMTKNKQGSIVNVSSVIGLDGAPGQVAYSASKAALLGMTKSAAKELAPLNIRVNAVAPGFINTQLTHDYSAAKRASVINNIAVGREGQPEDVAATIMHLLSAQSAYITGQTIRIDGMMSI
ncbi:SDR family oxidoreductase [Glaciecola sp. MH2013]|uniref:SDR family NAD(P)-dependent oxidoreductase n=1 Tax=Glaciecola sp. MH2013 TaxID=2785524 RepID=UPI00189DBCDF|nr:SDR family oxidoreductase [Glaciecola sp. MH2013]MBF7072361.1 SDR family oxidoreductase [Glaciecola sp. MH2013]